jgi:hypothetical protein
MRTQPSLVPDASQYTSKDFVMSGCANTGDVVNNFFRVQNASSRSAFQTNLSSFFRRSIMSLAILEKFRINLQ